MEDESQESTHEMTPDEMTPDEIVAGLAEASREIPVAALRAAQRCGQAMVPLLIRIVEEAAETVRRGDYAGDDFRLSLYLLADMRATEAWPTVRAALSTSHDHTYELIDVEVVDDLAELVGRIAGDDFDGIEAFLTDAKVWLDLRWATLSTFGLHMIDGRITREEYELRLSRILKIAVEHQDEIAVAAIWDLAFHGALATRPLIETAMEADYLTKFSGSFDDMRALLVRAAEAELGPDLRRLPDDLITYLIESAQRDAEEHNRIKAERDDDPYEDYLYDYDESDYVYSSDDADVSLAWEDDDAISESRHRDDSATIRNSGVRPGRNEPCPCGSGKKYKKCCGGLAKQ
ncbi:MAG: DUF1186 domain-containing protein [Planctomycetales bacterium]|nr:DUF1186 domain-containing protein [Planctomycetales bacterium]